MARVTLDADGYSVSNLLFLAANSDITFTSPAGATNTLTYRAVKTYDYATSTYSNYCGKNASLTLDRVKVKLKIDNSTGRLFTASTANQIPINVRRLAGPAAGSTIALKSGSYFSVLVIESVGKGCVFDISGESELHTASFHTGNGGTVSLSNGWLSVWYFNCDTHSFADGQKIVFKGDHPRLVFGRCGKYNGFVYQCYPVWNSATRTYDPGKMTYEYHLPESPYEFAPFANAYGDYTNTSGFPGGAFRMSDSNEDNLTISTNDMRVVIAADSPARRSGSDLPRAYRLFDWSGLSWKSTRLGITNAQDIAISGLKGRDSVFTEVREGWESVGLPQYFGVTLAPKSGLAIIFK